ncbi:hypothetical protein [Nocardia brasiliensis]|uniref:hypothetical protein n=1 Tax=Nocardia brasiliensis TaxID=37326 RepID=UPI0024590F0D|nr:hypothetical protein [Nocardia brasiliensis]
MMRSHQHRFAAHPQTGNVICTCGLTEVAAQARDPDYISACCGCPVSPVQANGLTINANSLVYCFACDRHLVEVVHRDQWQDEVCAGCGRTSAQAGQPSSWGPHWRTPLTGSLCDPTVEEPPISAHSCSDECAAKVEARRDANGVLAPIRRSIQGHVKRTRTKRRQPATG